MTWDAQPAPRLSPATRTWRALFGSPADVALTAIFAALSAALLWPVLSWLVIEATWNGTSLADCAGDGFCWPFIAARLGQFLYGGYPEEERWRVNGAGLIVLCALAGMLAAWGRRALIVALITPAVGWMFALALLTGGWHDLPAVDTRRWGGLALTLFLAVFGMGIALPLGIMLAFARRSRHRGLRILSGCWVEFWRSVPTVAILFVAITMFPLFVPAGFDPSPLARVVLAYGFTLSAYVCEAVRGGLEGISRDQLDGARSLGLTRSQTVRTVELPQALIIALPSLIGITIAVVKETSIVIIIGMADFLGTVQSAILDPAWRNENIATTGYFFAGLVFWGICFGLSRLSRALENASGLGRWQRTGTGAR